MSDEVLTALVKAAAELSPLVAKILGPAATAAGQALGDSLNVWVFKRRVRLLQEVERFVEDSGKEIKHVATRLFFPVLEAASIEDDDEMQTRWAALLANEATDIGSVHPSYIDILKQLSPDDARLLDKLCDWCDLRSTRRLTTRYAKPTRDGDREMEDIVTSHRDSFENLVRLGLVQPEHAIKDRGFRFVGERMTSIPIPPEADSWYELSDFAVRFVRACRAPTAQSGGTE